MTNSVKLQIHNPFQRGVNLAIGRGAAALAAHTLTSLALGILAGARSSIFYSEALLMATVEVGMIVGLCLAYKEPNKRVFQGALATAAAVHVGFIALRLLINECSC